MKNRWNWIILGLMAVSGYMLYWTNIRRTEVGYFSDGTWIFWNSLTYVIFFGLVTGYVIGNLISKVKKK